MNRHAQAFVKKATAIVAIVAIVAVAAGPRSAWAEPISLLAWNTTGLSGTTAGSLSSTTNATGMQPSSLSRGSGLTASSLSDGYASTSWNGAADLTEATEQNHYLEFVAQASTGKQLSADRIRLNFRNTSTGPTTFQWVYSLDGFGTAGVPIETAIASAGTASTNVYETTLSAITPLQDVTGAVTFRLYGWNASDNGSGAVGTASGDNLSLFGTLADAPIPVGSAYFWVGSDTTLGGAGTWAQTGGTSWRTTDTDGTGEAWDQTKTATFGGAAAGTVTVSDTVTAEAGMTFTTDGYSLSGGTVSLGGADATANTITTFADVSAGLAAVLTGTTGLTKAGDGSIELSAANTLSGGITVSGGSLVVAGADALGDNAVTINGGTLSSNATPRTISNPITFDGNGGLAADGSANLELDGSVSFGGVLRTVSIGSGATVTLSGSYGTGGITKSGSGTLVLGAAASLTGLGVTAGTLQIPTGVEVTTSSQPTVTGGIFEIDGTLVSNSTSGWAAPTAPVTVGATGTIVQQGNGSPTIFLFDSDVTWTAGSTFVFRDYTNSPSVSNRTYAMNLVFESTGEAITTGAISGSLPWTVAGDLTVGENVSFDFGTFSSTVAYQGNVTVAGVLGATNGARSFTIGSGKELLLKDTGRLNIAADQTVTIDGGIRTTAAAGQTATVSGGTLSLGGASRTIDVAAGSGAAGLSVDSGITDGAVVKSGLGTLTLSGTNTYAGGTTVNAGKLSVAADANLGDTAGGITLGGGTLEMTSGFTLNSGRTITATAATASTIAVTSGTVTYGGAFTGSGDLDKAGAGTLSVSNASSGYSGTFTISAGTLEVTGSNAFANATLTQTGGTLLLAPSGGGDVVLPEIGGEGGTVSIDSNANAVFSGTSNRSYNGQINGQGGLKKQGEGELTLNGNNGFSGATRIEGGTLKLGAGGSLSATSEILVDSGAIFDLTSKNNGLALGSQRLGGRGTILGDLEFGSLSELVFDASGPLLVGSGTISFAAGFGIGSIFGLDSSVAEGTYTLLNETTGGNISFANLTNVGPDAPFDLGGGKSAYFKQGSLQVVVVPEPGGLLLGVAGLSLAGLGGGRRRAARPASVA